MTLTRRWRSWSSRVGLMSRGRIWLKSGPAPNSLALSVSCLRADLRWGGVPFFTWGAEDTEGVKAGMTYNVGGGAVMENKGVRGAGGQLEKEGWQRGWD